MSKINQLTDMLRPAVEAVGFELWGLEYHSAGRHSVLRVFIDHENGIDVDDCAEASHQISGVLDVEDPISSEYNLEVSSPGMDRPLFTPEQFERYIDEGVSVKLHAPVNKRRKWSGQLTAVENGEIHLLVDGEAITFSHSLVEKANLVPTF